MIILAELQPLDTTAGTRKTLRASSANDPAVTGLNGVIWRPAISEEASIGIRLFKGDFDGEASPTGGTISIQIDQWLHIEANVRKFLWAGAPVKMYAGVSGQAWPWTTVFDGLVDGFTAEKNTIKLQCKVNTEPFDADVLTLKYAGTGGAEGGTDLKDKVKPFLLGRCFNVEPVLINSVDNVFQFSGYGAIQAINVLYERGSDFGPSMGNYTTYANLVAATIPPGQWATCLAQGMVRLGAPAYGVITADVDGDNVGGWWRKTGEIIQRVASNSAVSGSLIESASFTALDTALAGLSNQGRIGVYIDAQETVLDFASRLAAPCNAQVGVSLAGKLFVGRIAIGSPTITLDAQQRRLPRVTSSVESSVQPPFSYLEMGYARSWRVQSNDEIAGIDVLISARYPDPPPDVMLDGGIYVDATNKQFRYVGPTVFSDEGTITSDEGIVTSSGYEDIQDAGIGEASAAAAVANANAAVAQATADAALAQLAAIDDDGIIDINEKVTVLIPKATELETAYGLLVPLATARAISTTAITTKRTAWLAVLAGISPAWNDTSQNSPVVRNSLDLARDEYVAEIKSLEKEIAAFSTRNVNRGAWSGSSVAYVIGDIVDRSGSSYAAIVSHTSSGANGPPSANWTLLASQGGTGSTGPVAPTLTCSPPAWPIACTFNGTPKAAVLGFQINVFQGTTNVSATASYGTITAVGISGASVSSGGAVTVTGMTADTGYVEVPVTYAGVTLLARVDYTKVRDGNAAVSGSANVTSLVNTGTYASSANFNISLANGQTFNANANVSYDAASSTYTPQIKLAYVNVTDGGAETDMAGSEVTGTAAIPTDFQAVATSGSFTNTSGGTKVFNIRLLSRRSAGAGNSANVTGSVGGSG